MANEHRFFLFDPVAFLLSTAHDSNEEVGGYIRLLCRGWIDEKPTGTFPQEDAALSALTGCRSEEEWKRIQRAIKAHFKRVDERNNRFVQERLLSTFKKLEKDARERRRISRLGGKASAESKKSTAGCVRSTDMPPDSTKELTNQPTKVIKEIKPTNQPGVRQVLDWAGVGGGWKRCITVPGLTPLGVLIAAEKNHRGGGKGGALVEKLTNGYTPLELIHPELLSALCRRGRIASICGHQVTTTGKETNVGFSNHEIIVGGVSIHESKLFAEEIIVDLSREIDK